MSAAPPGWDWLTGPDEFARTAGTSWADELMARGPVPGSERYHAKQDRDIARVPLRYGSYSAVVYLKRHYEPLTRHDVLDTVEMLLGESPARSEASNIAWARGAGVPVPDVVAGGERLAGVTALGGGWRQSFLAVRELAGMLALHELIPLAAGRLGDAEFAAWKRAALAEAARLAWLLHARGAFHQDFYLCHLFLAESSLSEPGADLTGRITVIDFHRLARAGGARGANLWVKDLAQFAFSFGGVEGLSAGDWLTFRRAYEARAPRGPRLGWAPFWRLVAARAGAYARRDRLRRGRGGAGAPQ